MCECYYCFQIINLTLRDFVNSWYHGISDDTEFLDFLRKSANEIVANISARVRAVDWVPFLTTHLVDDFACHIRLFRKANEKLQAQASQKNYKDANESVDGALESIFFDLELEMEKHYCRDLVATDAKYEESLKN